MIAFRSVRLTFIFHNRTQPNTTITTTTVKANVHIFLFEVGTANPSLFRYITMHMVRAVVKGILGCILLLALKLLGSSSLLPRVARGNVGKSFVEVSLKDL